MSDAPEQIWLAGQDDDEWPWYWSDPAKGEPAEVRYIREDLTANSAELARLREKNERLTKLVIQERLENLWNAYNTGHERDGQWSHSFMSDGEWLVREIGLDPTSGWYDAAEVKRRIPEAAALAAQGET